MQSGAKRTTTSGVGRGRRRDLEGATPTLQTVSQTMSNQAAMCRQHRHRTRTGRLFVGSTAHRNPLGHYPRAGLNHGLWRSDWHGQRTHEIPLRSSASYR